MADPGVHLLRERDRSETVTALQQLGEPVSLAEVLGDLNRQARPGRVPARAARWGFRWDDEDERSRRWWPQGITGSADARTGTDTPTAVEAAVAGCEVVLTSSYAHEVDGTKHGSRITVVDVTDRGTVRYRHVLLVEAVEGDGEQVDVRPLGLHAGGIVWHGDHLHVAGTARGLASFRLDDVVRVEGGDPARLGVRGSTIDSFGYRYLLPVRFSYAARTATGTAPMRYSFASLDRSGSAPAVVAGEYARPTSASPATTRLVRYPIDPATALLRADEQHRSQPDALWDQGVARMQGATVVDGTWFVTTSRGRFRRGSLWVGGPGDWREHRWELAAGPEDIAYWPEHDELWSVSEHPRRRFVYAMPRGRFTGS